MCPLGTTEIGICAADEHARSRVLVLPCRIVSSPRLQDLPQRVARELSAFPFCIGNSCELIPFVVGKGHRAA